MLAEIIRFDQPWWLLCCLAAAAPIFISRRAARRGVKTALLSIIAQSLAILLLGLAVAQPVLSGGGKAENQCLILQDVSSSTRSQLSPAIKLPDGISSRQMYFADRLYSSDPRVQIGESFAVKPATIAGNALMFAAQSQDSQACVIVTDGQFTDPDWPTAARQLGLSGRKLTIIPMDRPPRDARISAMSAYRGSAGRAELTVTIAANHSASRTLTVSQEFPDRRELSTRKIVFIGGEDQTIRLDVDAPGDSSAEYLARLDRGDEFPENDSFRVAIAPLRQSAAVISSASREQLAMLIDAIAATAKMDVEFLTPSALVNPALQLQRYSAVAIVDSVGTSISPSVRLAVADYVRSGGGLVLIGVGPSDLPSDRNDPLNAVSALVPDPFSRSPLRIILALDASGSMTEPADSSPGEKPTVKFDLAREAASAIGRYVTLQDSLAVIVFADQPRVIYYSGDAPGDFDVVRRSLADVVPAGKTDIAAAISQGVTISRVDGQTARRPLLLLLSDLQPNAAVEFDAAKAGDEISRAGMSLGIVQTQGRHDPRPTALAELANLLSCPIVNDAGMKGVGEIFGRMIRHNRGDSLKRGKWNAIFSGEIFDVKEIKLPELDAILLTHPNNQAQVLTKVQDNQPLVAAMTAGLGKSVSLAVAMDQADVCSSPAQRRGISSLAAEAMRWVARRSIDPKISGQISRADGKMIVTVEFSEGNAPPAGEFLHAAILPLGQTTATSPTTIPMRRISLREFSISIPDPSGNVAAEVCGSSGAAIWRGGSQSPYPAEFSALGCNWENVRRLTELSGGRVLDVAGLEKAGIGWEKSRDVPIWYLLLLAAAAIALLEWSLLGRILR